MIFNRDNLVKLDPQSTIFGPNEVIHFREINPDPAVKYIPSEMTNGLL